MPVVTKTPDVLGVFFFCPNVLTLVATHCYTSRMATKTGKCKRCNRILTDPKSIAAGVGPKCAKKERAERVLTEVSAVYKPEQISKAIELIGDGGIVRVSRHTFTVVASNGVDHYSTTALDCTCAAGVYGRTCYHRIAAQLVAA